jgi:hypothetical protein
MAERRHQEPPAQLRAVVDDQSASDEFGAARMLGLVLIAALIFWGGVLGAALWLLILAR